MKAADRTNHRQVVEPGPFQEEQVMPRQVVNGSDKSQSYRIDTTDEDATNLAATVRDEQRFSEATNGWIVAADDAANLRRPYGVSGGTPEARRTTDLIVAATRTEIARDFLWPKVLGGRHRRCTTKYPCNRRND